MEKIGNEYETENEEMEDITAIDNFDKVQEKKQSFSFNKISNIIGIILCILFLPIFIVNVALLISYAVNPDSPPGFMGYTPLVVESDSMTPFFTKDDLVIIRNGEENQVYDNGTVICFESGNSYISHRIVKVTKKENGQLLYTTQGDANNTPDANPVNSSQILGSYVMNFKGLGGLLMFMQTPMGMICCVILPILLIFLLFYIPPKVVAAHKKRKSSPQRYA